MSIAANQVDVSVRGDLAGGVLPAIVAMLAARAECPLDRLEEALLLTDAVAAHAPGRSRDGIVRVTVAVDEDGLTMTVGGLVSEGAAGLLADATLPDVGAVLERLADELHTEPGDAGERLVLRIHYSAPTAATVDNG
jgi:hypothetical protein